MRNSIKRFLCRVIFCIFSLLFKHLSDDFFLPKRIDDEDDEMAVIEQDVQRLVIVTQVLVLLI